MNERIGPIHDVEPTRSVVKGMMVVMAEGPPPFRLCLRCCVRGIAMGLRDVLDAAKAADIDAFGELQAECLHIIDCERPVVVEGSETPQ